MAKRKSLNERSFDSLAKASAAILQWRGEVIAGPHDWRDGWIAGYRAAQRDAKRKRSAVTRDEHERKSAALLAGAAALDQRTYVEDALRRVDNFLAGTGASPTAVMLQAIRFDLLEALGMPLDAPQRDAKRKPVRRVRKVTKRK